MSTKYLEPRKWNYLRENIETSNSTTQKTGNFRISTGITRPRHVFVFIINDASNSDQTQNPFLYNTFSVANNRTLNSCHLEVGNGSVLQTINRTNKGIQRRFKTCSPK